jgi:subfamily B ATP-binding cassette protein MsbA
MKIFLRLFRYVLRYKQYLFLSIALGFVTSSLNIFNIFAFQPILEVMFTSEAEIKAKAAARETEEKKEEKKVKLPIIRTIETKIKPYRDAIDRRMDELTQWALQNKMKAIYLIAIIVAISALFKSVTAYASDFLMIYMGLSLIRDIRQEVHDHILKMDLTFFAKRTTGQLLSRSSNDVAALNSSIISLMDVGIQSPLTIILTLLLMYYLSPQLTVYAFFLVPLAIVFIAMFGRRIRRISKQAQKRIADVLDVMQETYNAIRVVKAFGMEEFESNRFRTVNEKANKTYLKRQAVKKIISPLMELLGVMAAVLVLMAGAHLIIREHILTGTKFFIFIFASSRLYRPIKDLSGIHLEIQSGLAGAERVFEILDTRQNLKDKPDALPLPPVKDKISFNNVSFHYENSPHHALQNITVDIRKGSVMALVGRSGAGKTTFANLLCRFYDPTEGSITVDGMNLRDVTLQSLRDRIAIVTQETILFNETIRNNIAYGRKDIPIEAIIDAAQKAYADEFIRNLPEGYDTSIGQQGGRLSGGQRQRIAIARAILKNPDILVFDEATSSLDSEAEQKIQQAMQNLIKGRTTLIIAHRLSTVKMADEILVLDAGGLIEHGAHEELLKQNGEYAKLCHFQGIFIDADNPVK